jgi:mevalonate kinase
MQPESTNKHFPAKLLLFGEYTVISGGAALAIPYPQYQGQWKKGTEKSDLETFWDYLKTLDGCNLDKVAQAEQENWVFEANIPLGYGLGSSGALSAAAYTLFFEEERLGLVALKDRLAQIESFFHGQSSGLDPLVSYTGHAVYIQDSQITTLAPPTLPSNLTLYDSGQSRNGKPLIQAYMQRLQKEPDFVSVIKELKVLNQMAITKLIAGEDISKVFEKISRLQLEHFEAMILEDVYTVWAQGLEEGRYMKLSGAGGGGCYMCYEV